MSRRFSDNLQALFGLHASDEMRPMLGRPLASVELSSDKGAITFRFQDGGEQAFGVEGDCCSHSWIEHLTLPGDVVGASIVDVRESGGVPWDRHECKPATGPYAYGNECGHDSLAVYHTKFVTDRGDIILEYRNDSNGYYGGYLVARRQP